MKEYRVTIEAIYVYSTSVTAENEDKAEEIARNQFDLLNIDGDELDVGEVYVREKEEWESDEE